MSASCKGRGNGEGRGRDVENTESVEFINPLISVVVESTDLQRLSATAHESQTARDAHTPIMLDCPNDPILLCDPHK